MDNKKKKIVIAGAGFGGITVALLLDKAMKREPSLSQKFNIVIINNHHSHLYTPALYETASIPQGHHRLEYVKSSIAIPLASIFHGTSVDWMEREITAIDPIKHVLKFDNAEEFDFAYLVLALGAETAYFNIPGAREFSFPLKTFADSIKLRDKVQSLIELGNIEPFRILIAGAGASGVEVAAEFENFIQMLATRGKNAPPSKAEVLLVEATPEILPGFAPWVIEKTKKRLATIGVQIKTGMPITEVGKNFIILKDGSRLPFSVLVWAGGVGASHVLKTMGLPLSPKGSITVDESLEAGKNIFAIGDNASFVDKDTGRPLPLNAIIAEEQARIAASNILANIKGTKHAVFNPQKHYPFILAVGRKYAVADLILVHEWGFLAWCLKLLVELKYLLFILPFLEALSTWWKYVMIARSND